jgi:AcrR family transcriptional regulator
MPERKFISSDIVDAAFRVIRRQGWEKCSARAIAQELGSSTMPIYSALKSMKNLEDEISRRASDVLIGYQTRKWSGLGFLDMGVGYVMFAQEEKNLFRMMYYHEPGETEDVELQEKYRGYVFDALMERLEHETAMEGLTIEQRRSVLYKMWVFSHGLAVLINNSVIEPMTEEQITHFLMDTGGLIIIGERSRIPGNTGKRSRRTGKNSP